MAATSAWLSGSVFSARRTRLARVSWRNIAPRRSWVAVMTPHANGVSSESPSWRRNSSVSADSVTCGIIALTSGGRRSATAHCAYPR